MAENRQPSKLAVILHADVAGSTALVQLDEHLAHERIQDTFRRFSDTITKYHGHVRELRGDALLAEFERVSDAVTAALAFQADHADHNARLNDNIRPTVRVGIAMGEVIIADNTVTGAGVVLAQRVEQLAEPGRLYITGAIHEALPQRMPFDQENLGEQELKGFDEPVRVYRVALSPGESIPPPQESSQLGTSPKTLRLIVAVAAITLVVAGGAAYWFKPWAPQEEPASVERIAFPLPDKPTIAVLPFDNLSGDPNQEYFSDGISENIITRLARVPHVFVIARNSSFSYKGKLVKVQQVGRELGAHYVVEGSIQKADDRIRITVQLIDSSTGKHLWADRYDRKLDNFFDLQDEITLKVVLEVLKGMEVKLSQQDIANIKYSATENVEAWSYYAKGLDNYRRTNAFNNAQARKFFNQALKLDPKFEAAMLGVAWTYYAQARWHWATGKYPYDRRDEFLAKAAQTAQLVMTRNDALAEPSALLGQVYMGRGNFDKAISFGKQAVAHNPNNADFHLILADILSFAGKPREALPEWEIATHLNPFPSDDFRFVYGRILYQLKRFEEAIPVFEGIVERNPDVFGGRERLRVISLALLIASYSGAGNPKARDLALKHPHSYGTILEKFFLFKEADDSQRILDDLAKAGLKY